MQVPNENHAKRKVHLLNNITRLIARNTSPATNKALHQEVTVLAM